MSGESGSGIDYKEYITIGLTLLLIIYITVAVFLESKKIKILHETIAGLIITAAFSISYRAITDDVITSHVEPEYLFEFVLPPIIFAAGYNIKREFFFKNLSYITTFGFMATLLNFILCTIFFGVVNTFLAQLLEKDPSNDKYDWNLLIFMKMSATLIASDTIAPLTTIDKVLYPQMFSIVFGEGVVNDAVALILMNTVKGLSDTGQTSIDYNTVKNFMQKFFISSAVSIFFGLFMGGISCLFHKNFRALNHFPILETCLVFLMSFITYEICELHSIQLAAIVAIFIFGLTQSHYNKYNLSKESVEKTGFVFGAIGYMCEVFIIIYLGLSFDTFTFKYQIFVYAVADFLVMLFSRFLVIYTLLFFMKTASSNVKLSYKKGILITLAGMVRGTIAYALIVKLVLVDDENGVDDSFVIPICQVIILITIIIFTPLNVFLFDFILGGKKNEQEVTIEDLKEEEHRISVLVDDSTQHFEKQQESMKPVNLFKKLDEYIIKPFLIYDYKNRAVKFSIFL